MLLPWAIILLAFLSAIGVYFLNNGFRSETDYALAVLRSGDQAKIRDYLLGYGAWAPVVSLVIMVAQAVIVGIPASLVMFANGVAFGTNNGAVINIVGRMAGAIISFAIARALGKGAVEKLVGKITHANKFELWMERRGGLAVFATRAIPGMPSDMLSYVAGFTKVSWRTYIVATLLGFLPQSIVFAWFGAEATGWFWVVMMSGSLLTGVLAVGAFIVQWVRRRTRGKATSMATEMGPRLAQSQLPASTGYVMPEFRMRTTGQPVTQAVRAGEYQRFL
jgi:uncharacterized membrane protein YdjX (TVP38/TMEM64 family)